MARVRFDEKYVFTELEKVGNALASPVTLYLIGGAAMIKYGLKAATKDIDILLHTQKEIAELNRALLGSGYHMIQTDKLGAEYQAMFTTQILENEDVLDNSAIRFRRHCLRNWPANVKKPHLFKITFRESPPKSGFQIDTQLFQQLLTIFSALRPNLFRLNNSSPYFPICRSHN